MLSVEILFHHWFPLLEKVEIRTFILPRNFPAVLIIFTGRGGAGSPPFPIVRGGAGNPPLPAGRVPCGAGRPSLQSIIAASLHLLNISIIQTMIQEFRRILGLENIEIAMVCDCCQLRLDTKKGTRLPGLRGGG